MNLNEYYERDKFIINILKEKQNGYFIEIGSNHPIKDNSTYLLENKFNWKGIMIENNNNFLPLYQQYRQNSIHIINDATKIDYIKLFEKNNVPQYIDYLYINLKINNNSTLLTLYNLNDYILYKYKFSIIIIKHDIYKGNYFDTREESRNILKKHGYILIFNDINLFEDLYIYPQYIDLSYVYKLKKINLENIYNCIITTESININLQIIPYTIITTTILWNKINYNIQNYDLI